MYYCSVPDDFKVNPGAVEAVAIHPTNPDKVKITKFVFLGGGWLVLRYDTIGRIELIPSIVLSSNNTNCKNDIQLFLQLFDELSVYRDYH